MSVTRDIFRAYRTPRAVYRARAGCEVREDRALVVLMLACGLIFLAQWPSALRATLIDDSVPFEGRIAAAILTTVLIGPLIAYAVGTFTHLIARLFGGRGSTYRARFALFWALLAASPLFLLRGLVAGFFGDHPVNLAVALVSLAAFAALWAANFAEAEWGEGL
ncbi:MAG: YIP1 family protein [Proteobacteria bacterium]|nr:MAG: YIP1 family protein [Rhodobacterales bacterium]PIE16873.1 MAG: YIP1 family protein [Pseudomonadota bacterium]